MGSKHHAVSTTHLWRFSAAAGPTTAESVTAQRRRRHCGDAFNRAKHQHRDSESQLQKYRTLLDSS